MDVSGGLSLVQTILQVLGSPTWMKFEAVLSVKSRLNKLKDTMSTIEALLLDAHEIEQLQQHRFTHIERNRLQRLKEALYQTDDLFDEIATLGHLKELMPRSNYKVCNEVRCFFSCSNQLCYAFKWSREMDNIMEMLDATVKDHRFDFGLRHPTGLGLKKERINARETYSYVCEGDVMIGREEDKRKVIDVMLLNTTVEQQDGFVVSIVGIGGLGKTTLARQVYNDEMIVEKFPRKLWVCVSDDFNVKALVGQILAAVNPLIKQDQMKLEELQTDLRKELDGKRYLLVLDDVWNEDSNKWLELRNVLIGGGRISGIVVTTRSKRVAEVVGSCYTHTLMGLSEDESLELLKKVALKPEEYPMKPQLVDIGRQIVQKCANVPLAIRVVGSLLRGQDESRWQYLEKTNLASVLQDESSGILPVLKISYYYLPFHLKSCFSYCAVFPKDYKFVKEDLICLWMAQGFIMPSDGKSLEDTGEEYFEQLLQRCFFQDIERSEGTNEIISFKMHDLIHDVASEVAGTEIVSSNCNSSCLNEKTRHISIDESSKLRTSDKMKRLRTFLFTDWSLRFWLKSSKKMKYLRVLRLNDSFRPRKLPGVVGKLVHLRYLDLSHNRGLRVLPSSITNLYNLQTLKLYKCTSLESLPRDLRKLVNLRLLDIYGCSRLTCMPPGMNSMASLQNLTGFVVGGTSNAWYRGSAGVFKLEYLENLIRHSEILEVVVKKGVRYNGVEARKGGFLSESKKLRNIRYYWIDWSVSNDSDNAEALLQSLHPNSYLRKLELQGYPGVRLPSWTMNLNTSLPNLVEIVIHGCDMLEHIPLMSQLRHLKVLELDGLYKVEYVESSNNSGGEDELVFFPSLEKLKLRCMRKLKGWWKSSSVSESEESETPQAPKLSRLEIDGCPELTTFPLCPGLQQLYLKDFNEALGPLIRETTQQKEEERHGRLREVRIDNLAYLNSLPIRSFHHISNLHISQDQKIEELKTGEVGKVFRRVWDHLTALESLSLNYLGELELEDEDDVINNKSTEEGSDAEMPWRYLAPTLRFLRLLELPKVVKLPKGIGCLSSLHSLVIWDCHNLESLTPSIGGLSSLHSLKIEGCDNLESLPPSIGGLSSLQFLEIVFCRKLKRMPEEMRHLTSLTKLDIRGWSPELTKECKNKTGANWSNIQHIPDIKLDF